LDIVRTTHDLDDGKMYLNKNNLYLSKNNLQSRFVIDQRANIYNEKEITEKRVGAGRSMMRLRRKIRECRKSRERLSAAGR